MNEIERAAAWREFMVEEVEHERDLFDEAPESLDDRFIEAFGQAMVAVAQKHQRTASGWSVMPDGTEDRPWYRTFMGLHHLGPYPSVLRKQRDGDERARELERFVTLHERAWIASEFQHAGVISEAEFNSYLGEYRDDWREFKAKLQG